MKSFICLLLLVLAPVALAETQAEIVLGTNVLQKKSQQSDVVEGGSVEHVKCILDQMQVKYKIRSLPWRRARQDVHANVIDGFFTAVAVDEASDFATFSAPLVLENWYWFWRTDTAVPASWKDHFQIGVILGSQQEAILSNEGYREFISANNLEQLVKLLFSKRIDVVLLDKEQFEDTLQKMNIQSREYKSRFFRYMPLGVYFGNPFLAKHPDFLTAFNSRISGCSSAGFELSPSEREVIKKVVTPWFQKIKSNKELVAAVRAQNVANETKSDSQLAQIDAQWQQAFNAGNLSFPQSILNPAMSHLLSQLQAGSHGLLSEIIVMDERGYNVAIGAMTSDYWQGDEEKFFEVAKKPEQTFYFDSIKYDASARRFQVQVSSPLVDAKSQKNLGVVMLGVDVDKALSLQH